MSYFTGRQKYTRPQAMLWAENSGTLADVPVQTGITATVTSGSNILTLTGAFTTSIFFVNLTNPQKLVQTGGGTGAITLGSTVSAIIDTANITMSAPATATGTVILSTLSTTYLPVGYEFGAAVPVGGVQNFLILSDHGRQPMNMKPTRLEQRQRMINGRMRSYHIADKLTIQTSWSMIPSRAYPTTPNFNTSDGTTASSPYTVDGGAGGSEMLDWYQNHFGSFWVYLAYDNHTNFGYNSSSYGHMNQYNEVLEMYISDFTYDIQKRGGSNFDMWNISVTLEEA